MLPFLFQLFPYNNSIRFVITEGRFIVLLLAAQVRKSFGPIYENKLKINYITFI
jgi:hypothetical protein